MTTEAAGQAPLGRRERHKRAAKLRLYTSALELFTERGYEKTTVEDITERADVGRGTFFNHFRRKEDLVSLWGEQRRDHLNEHLARSRAAQRPAGVVEELEYCMRALAAMNETEWARTRTMLLAWVKAGRPVLEEPHAADIFADIVATGIEHGEIAPDVDARRVGNLLRDAYLGTLYRWAQFEEPPGPLADELIAILSVILRGILPAGRVSPA
ncbi:TetR/AcrR family transcriptional regulator [Amycolatopsis australiensis]|nr:TetR/AcrR family transcriptional regulator [Amycolatopsis australiensis]